jgi:hypothetical protein
MSRSHKALYVIVVAFLTTLAFPLAAQDRGVSVMARELVGKSDFDVGRQYAVIIGIDRYKEWPALRSAVAEAKSVRVVLGERYYIDEFFELYDADATAANIRRLFVDTLPKKVGTKDSLLVFYAGHGQLDATKTGFWIASDGSQDPYAQNNWIPNAQLRNMIGGLKAQRILVLADACFAGDFLNVSRSAAPVIDSAYFRQALQLTARQVLTSGASETVPDESEFGRQLLNLLERNEEPCLDPVIMYDRIRRGVTKTLPLLGTMPGNEEGASFVLFLKSERPFVSTASARATLKLPANPIALLLRSRDASTQVSMTRIDANTYSAPAGFPISLVLESPYAEKINPASLQLNLAEGETRDIEIPVGRFELPWIPGGATVSIGSGKTLELKSEVSQGYRSLSLPQGEYRVSLRSAEIGMPYEGRVVILAGTTVEPSGYRNTMSATLEATRSGYAKRVSAMRTKSRIGWASLIAGAAGAAGTSAVYFLGAQAMEAYRGSMDAATATAHWKTVSMYQALFPLAAAVGGLGLGISPFLLFGGPDPQALQRSMDALDEGIRALGK